MAWGSSYSSLNSGSISFFTNHGLLVFILSVIIVFLRCARIDTGVSRPVGV